MIVSEWLLVACAVLQVALGAGGLVLTRPSGRVAATGPRAAGAFRLLAVGLLLFGAATASGVARRAADRPGAWWSAAELVLLGLAVALVAVGLVRLRREHQRGDPRPGPRR